MRLAACAYLFGQWGYESLYNIDVGLALDYFEQY